MFWLITLGSSQSSSCRFPLVSHLLLILAYSTHLSRCLDPSASVTIDQVPAYSLQRQCGKGCIQNNYDPGADVERVLGCTWNGCYCGTQYQSAATSIITSCWSAYCAAETSLLPYDISTALSIYDAYCGIGAAATAPTTVPATTTGINSPTSTTGINETPSQTGNLDGGATTTAASATGTARSSGSSPLSSGSIIGIGVSVACSVLGLVFGIGFKIWKHRQTVKRQDQQRRW